MIWTTETALLSTYHTHIERIVVAQSHLSGFAQNGLSYIDEVSSEVFFIVWSIDYKALTNLHNCVKIKLKVKLLRKDIHLWLKGLLKNQ